MNGQLFVEGFVTLFVIMDPPGTIPLFLALTANLRPGERRRAAWQAVAVSFGVIVAFALFGQAILDYLNISLAALQGAGGLLLLLVALELLTGKLDDPEAPPAGNIALVPLGTPLLAGPGPSSPPWSSSRALTTRPTFSPSGSPSWPCTSSCGLSCGTAS